MNHDNAWDTLFLYREQLESLEAVAKDPPPGFALPCLNSIKVRVSEYPKADAMAVCAMTGKPVAFTDEQGSLYVVNMPTPNDNPLLPFLIGAGQPPKK